MHKPEFENNAVK